MLKLESITKLEGLEKPADKHVLGTSMAPHAPTWHAISSHHDGFFPIGSR